MIETFVLETLIVQLPLPRLAHVKAIFYRNY